MFNLTYGQALEAVKQGKLIARLGWNGKGMFVFMRPADELPVQFLIDKVKSVPQALKNYFAEHVHYTSNGVDVPKTEALVSFTAYLCMKAADGTIVNGWLASQTDMLSDDWGIL